MKYYNFDLKAVEREAFRDCPAILVAIAQHANKIGFNVDADEIENCPIKHLLKEAK